MMDDSEPSYTDNAPGYRDILEDDWERLQSLGGELISFATEAPGRLATPYNKESTSFREAISSENDQEAEQI